MAERDRFELDLAAALRAFAEDAPTQVRPVELARQFAATYPHRRIAIPHWRLAAVPSLAWVLLAAVLTALVGGMLVAGSRPERSLPAVLPPIGQIIVCPPESTPDEPGPVDQARPAGSKNMAFDRRAGRLVVHVVGVTELVETWTFDVCTNTWSRMHPNREPPNFSFRPLVYDVDSDLTLGVAYGPDGAPPGRVWAYDLGANTWTEKVAPTDRTLRAYDPLSGLTLATKDFAERPGQQELWTYEVETDTWTLIDRATGPASHAGLAYDGSVDRIVAYSPPETWLFDIRTSTWSRASAETPVVEPNWAVPTITYDESAELTVVTGSAGMAAYDAATNRWEVLARPFESYPTPTVYDPVNGRLVGFGWEGDVVAFDLKTREWTVLLEPSGGQRPATPSPTASPDDALVADLAAVMSSPYDAARVAALYAPDAVIHNLIENTKQRGLGEIGARIRYCNTQDFKVVVTSAPIRQGDFVASFVKFGGGEAAFPGLVVYELKDGKVMNQWVYSTP